MIKKHIRSAHTQIVYAKARNRIVRGFREVNASIW